MLVEHDLSQVDMGCNYRREVSQPLRHVPGTLSAAADVWALGTAKGVAGAYVCTKLLHPLKIGLSFPHASDDDCVHEWVHTVTFCLSIS